MKTSVIEVRDMLSVLSVLGVEERIGAVPGVESVTVNFAAGNATVRFDETRLRLADIKSDVRQHGSEDVAATADAKSGGGSKTTSGSSPGDAPMTMKGTPAAAADTSAAPVGKEVAPPTPPAITKTSAEAAPAAENTASAKS